MNREQIKESFVTNPKVGSRHLWIPCFYQNIFVKVKLLKKCAVPLQDVDASEIKVQVCVYAFDLLYLNGEVRPSDTNITQRSLNCSSCLFKNFHACECIFFLFISVASTHVFLQPRREAGIVLEYQWRCYWRL